MILKNKFIKLLIIFFIGIIDLQSQISGLDILNKVEDKEKIVNLVDQNFDAYDVAIIDIEDDVYVDMHCNCEEEDNNE